MTVIADRAGLVMYPDAKVKINGAQVGKVASIEPLPDGGAALHLAIDPAAVGVIPANVGAEITSSTVFGSKFVELVAPAQGLPAALRAGTVIQGGDHVTVELVRCSKLVSGAVDGRTGEAQPNLGGAVDIAARTRPSVRADPGRSGQRPIHPQPGSGQPQRRLEVSPTVFDAVADASPDLVATLDNTSRIADTVVDRRDSLDALLISAIGLADIGNDVLSTNRGPLADVVHLLVPTTDLTNQYNPALYCGIAGLILLATGPGLPVPGAVLLQGSSSAGSATGIRAICRRSRPPAGRSAPICPTSDTNSGRRTWSPISEPTRRSTGTRASC